MRARGSAWLQFIRPNGTAPDTLAIQLNPAGLDSGTYHDTVVVSTNNSEAPPLRIPVQFQVHPCRVTSVPLDTVVTGPLDGVACGSPRAAGTFCAQNRLPLIVPCHRVVAAGGIGGYGSLGVEYKRRLLELEGAAL